LNGELNSLIDRKKEEDDLDITISNQLTREKDLKIKLSEFIFAEADKNNVEVYYLYGEELRCKSIRTTITSVQEELNHSNLFRCHRSFIVNLSKIESAKGNSNGYLIKLKHYKKELPISRKYVTDFKSFIY
jgi:DNA-binding LytR/AlgR family response regulator